MRLWWRKQYRKPYDTDYSTRVMHTLLLEKRSELHRTWQQRNIATDAELRTLP